MRSLFLALVLIPSMALAGDGIKVTYQPGFSLSRAPVTLSIGRPIRKPHDDIVPKVFELLSKIDKLGVRNYSVPDAASISIEVEVGGQRLESSSCHTLMEASGQLVATSTGVSPLDGRTLEAALANEPEDFLAFRRLWEEALALSIGHGMVRFSPSR